MSASQSNEGTISGPLERRRLDGPYQRPISPTQALVPLLAVAALSLTVGLLPYAALRRQLSQQRRLISELHADVRTGNRMVAELTKSHEVEKAAHRLHEQKLQMNLQSSLQSLEGKYQSATLTQEQDVHTLRDQVAKSTIKVENLEEYAYKSHLDTPN